MLSFIDPGLICASTTCSFTIDGYQKNCQSRITGSNAFFFSFITHRRAQFQRNSAKCTTTIDEILFLVFVWLLHIRFNPSGSIFILIWILRLFFLLSLCRSFVITPLLESASSPYVYEYTMHSALHWNDLRKQWNKLGTHTHTRNWAKCLPFFVFGWSLPFLSLGVSCGYCICTRICTNTHYQI